MACIYRITNRLDGKQYVGQTMQKPSRRFTLHKNQARRGHGHYLHRAMRAHGEEHFMLDIIEECEREQLNEREIFWIAKLDTFENGYNLNEGGKGNPGRHHSESTRQRMRDAHWSRASKRDACIERIRDANTGRVLDESTRQKIGDGIRGLRRSLEQRERYSQSKQGSKNPMYGKPGPGCKPVAQYTYDGELVAIHPSAKSAAASLGKSNPSAIQNCCQGKSGSSYSFVWKYISEDAC